MAEAALGSGSREHGQGMARSQAIPGPTAPTEDGKRKPQMVVGCEATCSDQDAASEATSLGVGRALAVDDTAQEQALPYRTGRGYGLAQRPA